MAVCSSSSPIRNQIPYPYFEMGDTDLYMRYCFNAMRSRVAPVTTMGARGPKSKCIDEACPNKECEIYGQAGQGNIASNGTYYTNNGRIRKYVCRSCGTSFCDHKNTALFNLRTDDEKVLLVLKMIVKGMRLRATAEVLEANPGHHPTVGPQGGDAQRGGERRPAQGDRLVEGGTGELWTFDQKTLSAVEQFEDEGTWVWTAVDPEHKAAFAHRVGERKQSSANELIERIKELVAGIPSFCSDGLELYKNALLNTFNRVVRFTRAGKRGRLRSPGSFRMRSFVTLK